MTSPSPNPHDAHSANSNDRSSGSSLSGSRPQQHAWGPSSQPPPARRGLTPLSTSINSGAARSSAASQTPRNPWSPPPGAGIAAGPSSSGRHITRNSSISSPPSPFASPTSASQPSYSTQLPLSSRSRNIASPANPQLATSAATASQGGGIGGSSSGGGASRLSRASPSLSQSTTEATGAIPRPSGGQVSKIIVTQISLLLSTLKEDQESAKRESQIETIRKLVDSHGMEVFTKYFSRLVNTNKAQIWGQPRSTESTGSYQMLVSEIQKVSRDPQQASKIVESIDTGEGEIFNNFDLSTFLDHFRVDPVAKAMMALAFKQATKLDLRSKGETIFISNFQPFLNTIANPTSEGLAFGNGYTTEYIASLIERIAQDPPRGWNDDMLQQLDLALGRRYLDIGSLTPPEISSAMSLFVLLAPQNPLVRLVHRTGPHATESLDACKAMLQSADLRDFGYQQVANTLLFMTIARTEPVFDAGIFVTALREHRGGQRLDWQDVVHAFDRDNVTVTKDQFLTLYKALLPLADESENFDLQLLWGGDWNYPDAQLSFVSAFLSHTAEDLDAAQIPRLRMSFKMEDFADASDEAKSYAEKCVHHPFVSFDAAKALFNMVFRSNETYQHAQSLGIVENVINKNMDLFVCSVSAVPKPWGALQEQAMRQLVQSFLMKAFEHHTFVFHILFKRDRTWLFSRLQNFYQQDQTRLYHIFDRAQDHGWLHDLIAMNNELSLDLVAYAHGRKLFDLDTWLHQTAQSIPGPGFVKVLVQFLNAKAEDDILVHREGVAPSTVPLTVRTVHALLGFLGERVGEGLQEDDLVQVQRYSIQAYPRLINYGEGFDEIIDKNGEDGNALPPEADARMQEHYKKMYSNESGVRDIIKTLQSYKTSTVPQTQELFSCMIFGLFDEYSCFGDYPLDALAVTAVLFGSIINYKLLGRTAIQCAIAMVLEAVRDKSPETSMYKFGLQALIQFQDRLQDWPTLCDRLVNVPGLQGTEPYKTAQEVLAKHQGAQLNGESQNGNNANDNVDGFLAPSSKYPNFTCVSVDPPLRPDFYEQPEEKIQEAILFIFNNVSERNLDVKLEDLKNELEEKHFQWFASFLVEERAKGQANLQQLYLDILSTLNNKLLWAEVLRETYLSIITMLNADSTMSSSSERTSLKNLGNWLGLITLARNKAIRFKNMSFKDLLIEAHDTGRLIVAIPFICKVLSLAVSSKIFKPPNAWTMEIISILLELYHHVELKLNLKFEIEVLCKILNLDHKTTPTSQVIRVRPQEEDDRVSTTMPDGIEGFGEFSLMGINRTRAIHERFSPSVILPDFVELTALLKHNYPQAPSNATFQNKLKQVLDSATQQAVQEIISPVVERSVTIAAISSSQLVAKDFALEPDETRYRDSAHTAVQALAGSLALVTCKEPLRTSMTSNIRAFARESDVTIPEGMILMFVNDNLGTVCSFVERAAEHASISEIDSQIEEALRVRKNQTYREPQISRWAYFVPEPYKPVQGGLNREQMSIYEDFGRSAKGSLSHTLSASQDASRQLTDALQDQFRSVPPLATPADAPAIQRQAVPQANTLHSNISHHPVNGYGDGITVAERLADIIADLQHAATEVGDNQSDSQIVSLVQETLSRLRTLVSTQPPAMAAENICLGAAHEVFARIMSDSPSVAATEALVQILQQLTLWSESVSYLVRTWLAEWNETRLSDIQATIILLKNRLLDPEQVDIALASSIKSRDVASLEVFKALIDNLVTSDPPYALRSDFATCMTALRHWLTDEPGLPLGEAIFDKLRDVANVNSPVSESGRTKKAQAEYILDEFMTLKRKQDPDELILSFVWQLHKAGILGDRENVLTLFRNCYNAAIFYPVQRQDDGYSRTNDNQYQMVDSLAAFIVVVATFQSQAQGETKNDKATYFGWIIGMGALLLIQHQNRAEQHSDQKKFFRLLSSVLCQIQESTRLSFEEQTDLLVAFGKALLLLQPGQFPSFSFAWLNIISHRVLIPGLLNLQDDTASALYVTLLQRQLNYLSSALFRSIIFPASQELYRGTLKLLLILRQDYPDFVSENCYQLLPHIPLYCPQMKNLILSDTPSSIPDLPDPFTEGFKIERLSEIKKNPKIVGDFQSILSKAGILEPIDRALNGGALNEEITKDIIQGISNDENKHASMEYELNDSPLLNAMILHIIKHAESASAQGIPLFSATSIHTDIFEMLVTKLNFLGRQHLFQAMFNQLRYPNTYTQFYSQTILHLFRWGQTEKPATDASKLITRVLIERSIAQRPHPWGLNMTVIELLNNRNFRFWDASFIKAAPVLEHTLHTLFQQMGVSSRLIA